MNIRRAARYPVEFPGRLKRFGTSQSRPVVISDFSNVGCRISPAEDLRAGAQILVKLPGLKFLPATIMWKRLDRAGVNFQQPLHPLAVEEFSHALAEPVAAPDRQSA